MDFKKWFSLIQFGIMVFIFFSFSNSIILINHTLIVFYNKIYHTTIMDLIPLFHFSLFIFSHFFLIFFQFLSKIIQKKKTTSLHLSLKTSEVNNQLFLKTIIQLILCFQFHYLQFLFKKTLKKKEKKQWKKIKPSLPFSSNVSSS